MKIVSNKTFPHPVLRETGDDYTHHRLQVTRNFDSDSNDCPVLTFNFAPVEEKISNLIKSKRAMYAIEILCPTTYMRHAHTTYENSGKILLGKGDLHDTVEVNAFVVCEKAEKEFHSDNFNAEFNDSSYVLLPGDVLAVADTMSTSWTTAYENTVFSVFEIVADSTVAPGSFTVDTGEDKVKIRMCQKDKSQFEAIRSTPEQKPVALLFYLPVVAEVLRQMASVESESKQLRWYRSIERQIEEMEKSVDVVSKDPLKFAQDFLHKPMKHIFSKS